VKAGRIILGAIVFVLVVGLGYLGYQRYLAPLPETPTPQAPPPAAAASAGPEVVSAEGVIVPVRHAELAFRTGGRVAEALVASGDVVEAGDILARLEDDDLRASVAQAEAALEAAQAQLALSKARPRPEEVAVAEEQIEAARATLSQAAAQRDQLTAGATEAEIAAAEAEVFAAEAARKAAEDQYDQIKDNVHGWIEEQAILQLRAVEQALEAAQARLAHAQGGAGAQRRSVNAGVWSAEVQRDIAQAQLHLLQAGASQEEVAAAEAAVRQAEAALEAAQVALAEAELQAPFAGTVADVTLEVGEIVAPGAPVAIIADFSAWRIETDDLSEVDVVEIRVGQAVEVRVDALPDQTFHGQVTEVPLVSELKRGDVTYTVTIELDDVGDAPLRWGMKVFVDIQVGRG
jgi:multidrug efflux pump subunit AcrA (membrane-fusion protein)